MVWQCWEKVLWRDGVMFWFEDTGKKTFVISNWKSKDNGGISWDNLQVMAQVLAVGGFKKFVVVGLV